MTYKVISGLVTPAVTGGVFGFAAEFTPVDTLLTSPAYILASYLIEQAIGSMTLPSVGQDWPLYVSYMPDNESGKTNLGTMYDTTGLKDGRLMEGEVIQHYGIQLKIRSDDYNIGWVKIETIATALDAVVNQVITIGSMDYQIYNCKRIGSSMSLGREEGTKERHLFIVNFAITLKRSSP